jgi:hypothetical protein
MTPSSRPRVNQGQQARMGPRACIRRGSWAAVVAMTIMSVSVVPQAVADSSDTLRAALLSARGASCAPLRDDPMVEKTAEEVNDSTDKWLNHAARAVPVTDAMSVLKDLGYGGSKATILYGAGSNDLDATKALLLQGYLKIPDCSYSDYGVSALHNTSKDMTLLTVVLAA